MTRRRWMGGGAVALAVSAALSAGCADTHRATIVQQPPPGGQALPVEFVWNLPVVEATIEGEPIRLIVDTGGHDALTLKDEVIDRLPTVKRTGRRQMSRYAWGQVAVERQIIVPQIAFGDVIAAEVHGRSITLPVPDELAAQVDGYVGEAFLSRFRLLVEYPDRIVLHQADEWPEGLDVSGWSAIRMDSAGRVVGASLDGRPLKIGWDTGASHTVVDDRIAHRMFGASNGPFSGRLVLDGNVFDDVELHVHTLRGTPFDVVIGHGFYMRHRVLFDFPSRTVFVETGGG